ncbi:MAG: hypothetical protein M1326_01925, partial [Cyanobacteria bacterium]|nr:hypothetical protein [Cyanobacteriota bacterium]
MKEKRFILLFTIDYPPLKIGSGIANYTYNIASNLYNLGEEIIVIAPYVKGCRQFDNRQGFKTLRIPAKIFLREFHALFLIFYLSFTGKINKILNFNWFPCGVIALINYYFFKTSYFVFVYGADYINYLLYYK